MYEADRMGLAVSDDELRSYLHQGQLGQMLFPGGNFIGQQAYEDFIQNQFSMGVQQFEQEVKARDCTAEAAGPQSMARSSVSDKDVAEQVQKQGVKVKFDYAVLTLDDIKKQIKPTDAELKAFYDQNKQQYVNSIPEKRKARYILIDTAKLADKISVSQAQLQQYYNQHQDEFRIPETVTVRHILIKTPPPGCRRQGRSEGCGRCANEGGGHREAVESRRQLRGPGEEVLRGSRQRAEWWAAAAAHARAARFRNSSRQPSIRQLARPPTSSAPATASTLSMSKAKQDARLKPLDEVKSQIEPLIKQQKARPARRRTWPTPCRRWPAPLVWTRLPAKRDCRLSPRISIAQTDPLPGVGNAKDLDSALFTAKKNDPAATAPTSARLCDLPGDRHCSHRKRRPSSRSRRKVEEQFKDQRAQALLAQKTQELSDRAHADHDLKKAAKDLGATVKTSDLVDANAQVPDIGPMNGAASRRFQHEAR